MDKEEFERLTTYKMPSISIIEYIQKYKNEHQDKLREFYLKETTEILDKYSIDELNKFFYSLDDPTKAALKPYFLQRMKSHLGF